MNSLPKASLTCVALFVCVTTVPSMHYNLSVLNIATDLVQNFIKEWSINCRNKHLSADQLSYYYAIAISMHAAGCIIGSLTIHAVMKVFYRKTTVVMVIPALSITGSSLQALSVLSNALIALYAGRLIAGIAGVYAMAAVSVYLVELAPKQNRGFLSSFVGVIGLISSFSGVFAGMKSHLGTKESFWLLVWLPSIPSIFLLFASPWLPHSPQELVVKGSNEAAALKVLQKYHGEDANFEEIIQSYWREEQIAVRSSSLRSQLHVKAVKEALYIAIVSGLLKAFCMLPVFRLYSTYFFQYLGITHHNAQLVTASLYGTESFIILTAPFCVNYFKRRSLYLGGHISMNIFNYCIVIFGMVTIRLGLHGSWTAWVCCGCMFGFLTMASIGTMPIGLFIAAEVAPEAVRPVIKSIDSLVNFTTVMLITSFYPILLRKVGLLVHLALATMTSACISYLYFRLPETHNVYTSDIVENMNTPSNRTDRLHLIDDNEVGKYGSTK